jgi:biopolymer transport protein ExbD
MEMLPLIDVVFLLLTFFIYAMLVLFPASALKIAIQPIAGQHQAGSQDMRIILVNAAGGISLDDQQVTREALFTELGKIAELEDQPGVYVLFEAAGTIDRAPLLIELAAYASSAGLDNFRIVGPESREGENSNPNATQP